MTTTQTTNKPVTTIRDGALKAVIWENTRNDSEKGSFYSVELSRTYKGGDDKLHDAHSFTGSELLRIARLANLAYDEIGRLSS